MAGSWGWSKDWSRILKSGVGKLDIQEQLPAFL
jgi:hypothetical protein